MFYHIIWYKIFSIFMFEVFANDVTPPYSDWSNPGHKEFQNSICVEFLDKKCDCGGSKHRCIAKIRETTVNIMGNQVTNLF